MYPFAASNGNQPFVIGLTKYTISHKKNEKRHVFDNDARKSKIWKARMIDHFRQATTQWATVIASVETATSPSSRRP